MKIEFCGFLFAFGEFQISLHLILPSKQLKQAACLLFGSGVTVYRLEELGNSNAAGQFKKGVHKNKKCMQLKKRIP